jgi:hypothetical protein
MHAPDVLAMRGGAGLIWRPARAASENLIQIS